VSKQSPFNNIDVCMLNEGFFDSVFIKNSNQTELSYKVITDELKKGIDSLRLSLERSIFKAVRFQFNTSAVPNFFLTNPRKFDTKVVYKATLPVKKEMIIKAVGLSEELVMNELYNIIKETDNLCPYFNVNVYYTNILQNEVEILFSLNDNYCLPSYYNSEPHKTMSVTEAVNEINKNVKVAISSLKNHPLGQFIPFTDKSNIIDIDGVYPSKGKFISTEFNFSSMIIMGTEFKNMDIFLNLYFYLSDCVGFKDKDVCLGLHSTSDSTGYLYLRIKPNFEVK